MSTENISEQVEAARKALGQLTTAAERRLNEVRNSREGLGKERVKVAQGAQLAVRGIDDIDAEYEEEESQLAGALSLTPTPVAPPAPAVVDEPDIPAFMANPPAPAVPAPAPADDDDDWLHELYTRSQLEGMSDARLSRLAFEYGMDEPVTFGFNRGTAISRIVEAQSRWCEENNQADPNNPTRTQRVTTRVVNVVNVRTWGGIQWLLACIGLVVGLYVGSKTYGFDEFGGFGHGLFSVLWVGTTSAVGFFFGGFIGGLFDEHNDEA